MKQLAELYIKALIIFISVHITPAAIAAVVTFKFSMYTLWIESPMYHAVMFFVSLICTMASVAHMTEK